jgi:phenylpropionate dioxygenase-like ring-hydroxylating dioxygenase large terminal subunit
VCPYHRWAFRLDGSFVGAPDAAGADLDDVCLTPLRHAVWNGFVLVDLAGDAPDPSVALARLDEHLAPWRWAELVTVATRTFESTWNWKVMVENWIECYHHLGAHRDTVEPLWPAAGVTLLPAGDDPWAAMTVEGVEGIGADARERIPGLGDDRARDLSVWAAFPLLLGGSTANHAFWLEIDPIDVTHHTVTWHLLAHPGCLLDAAAVDVLLTEITAVHVEDMRSCRDVQAGLASGRIDRFRLTRLERPIADFQRFVAARLGRAG